MKNQSTMSNGSLKDVQKKEEENPDTWIQKVITKPTKN